MTIGWSQTRWLLWTNQRRNQLSAHLLECKPSACSFFSRAVSPCSTGRLRFFTMSKTSPFTWLRKTYTEKKNWLVALLYLKTIALHTVHSLILRPLPPLHCFMRTVGGPSKILSLEWHTCRCRVEWTWLWVWAHRPTHTTFYACYNPTIILCLQVQCFLLDHGQRPSHASVCSHSVVYIYTRDVGVNEQWLLVLMLSYKFMALSNKKPIWLFTHLTLVQISCRQNFGVPFSSTKQVMSASPQGTRPYW